MPARRVHGGGVEMLQRGAAGRFFSNRSATLQIACGQCVGCRLERSRQWAVRIMHEAQLVDQSMFLTLTYADDHLPPGGSLDHRDWQLFAKRVRKQFGPFRFYMCGEYGEESRRPHFHACVFGFRFPDAVPVSSLAGSGSKLWRSPMLDRLWGKGNANFGSLTFDSAAYVARYVMKKVTGDAAENHYCVVDSDGVVLRLKPEYCAMSRRPGIGRGWLDKFSGDVFPHGKVVSRGVEANPPRYYKEWFKRSSPEGYAALAERLRVEGLERFADGTDARLAVREACSRAALNLKKRS